jgi:hypothetical protein
MVQIRGLTSEFAAHSRNIAIGFQNSTDVRVLRGAGPTEIYRTDDVFVAGNWHYLEIEFRAGDSPDGIIIINVNGVNVLSETAADTNAAMNFAGAVQLRMRAPSATTNPDDFYAIDDFYVIHKNAGQEFLNGPRVKSFPPTGDTAKNWEPSTGVDNYALVDENGLDTTDYVETDTTGDIDNYTLTDISGDPQSEVLGVKLEADIRNETGGTPSIEVRCDSNGTISQTSAIISNTTDFVLTTLFQELNPDGDTPWTIGTFNAMTAGVRLENNL